LQRKKPRKRRKRPRAREGVNDREDRRASRFARCGALSGKAFGLARSAACKARRAAASTFHRLKSRCYTPTHSNKRSARPAHVSCAWFSGHACRADARLSFATRGRLRPGRMTVVFVLACGSRLLPRASNTPPAARHTVDSGPCFAFYELAAHLQHARP
jgi:hypothetical protein